MSTRSTTPATPPGASDRAQLDLPRRLRRLRRSPALRALVRETRLSPDMFLYPLFVCTGTGQRREVPSMPGVFQLSVDEVVREAAAAKADGVLGVLLFGLPDSKDATGSAAWDADAPVQSAIRALKQELPDLLVVTDVCLCEYTSHGHCGLLVEGEVVNDATVELLARSALSHAAAGADIVAPSDMMDGRVGRIRRALDDAGLPAGRDHVVRGEVLLRVLRPVSRRRRLGARLRRPALAPDGPRQRRGSAARGRARHRGGRGHRHGEAGADVSGRHRAREGRVRDADGRVQRQRRVRDAEGRGRNGWIDEPRAMMETLTAIRRAGADIIITYYAREAARLLK